MLTLTRSRPWPWCPRIALQSSGCRWLHFTWGLTPRMAVWDLLEEPVVVFAGDREVVTFEPLLLLQPFLFPICPWRLATKWAVSPSLWWVSPWLPSISGSNWNTVSFCRCNTTSGRLFCLLQWWLYQSLDHDEHLLFHPWAGVMAWLVVWSVPHLNFSFGQPGFIFRKIVSIQWGMVGGAAWASWCGLYAEEFPMGEV